MFQNDIVSKIFLLNVYTLFLVSLWHIINGSFESYIVPWLNFNKNQQIIFWIIIAILTIVMLFLFDRLDLIAECKKKGLTTFQRIKEQVLIGLIFILFWRATYTTYDLIFDIFLEKTGLSENLYIIVVNLIVAYVTFMILFDQDRLDLIIKNK